MQNNKRRNGMTKEESKSFWNTVEQASKYVDSWPKWKKEGYELDSSEDEETPKNQKGNNLSTVLF